MAALRTLLSFHVLTSLGASALILQTFLFSHLPVDYLLLTLGFLLTLSGYHVYHLSLPAKSSGRSRVRWIWVLSALLPVLFLIFLRPASLWVILSVTLLGMAYRFITAPSARFPGRGGLKPVLLALVWTGCTMGLPLAATGFSIDTGWVYHSLQRFCFLLMLCVVFDIRDERSDRRAGRRSWFSPTPLASWPVLFVGLTVMGMTAVMSGFWLGLSGSQICLAGMALLPALLILPFSIRPRGFYFYALLVDGLMLVSTLLTYLMSIE